MDANPTNNRKLSSQVDKILPVNKCWELFTELNIQDITEINDQDKIRLFEESQIESWQVQTVIKNKPSNNDYYIVALGQAEMRTKLQDNKIIKQRLGIGSHFLNKAGTNRKLIVYSGCTTIRISAERLLENIKNLMEMVDRLRIMKKSLLITKLEQKNIKELAKQASAKTYVKGKYIIPSEQNLIYFILDGSCDLIKDQEIISILEQCMFGEQVLFKNSYDYSVRVRTATAKIFSITKQQLFFRVNGSTFRKIQRQYEERLDRRNQSLKKKQKQRTKSEQKQKIDYQQKLGLMQTARTNAKVDFDDSEFKKTFSYCLTYRKHQFQQTDFLKQTKQPDSSQTPVKPVSTNSKNANSMTRPKLKFKRTPLHQRMKTEDNTKSFEVAPSSIRKPINTTQNEESQKQYVGYRFAGLANQKSTMYISTKQQTQKSNFIQEIDKKIMKRLLILSGKREDFIFDELEESRKSKELILRGFRGNAKKMDLKHLYRILTVNRIKSPVRNRS